jgi:3-dehydroquinate synthase
MPSAATFPVLSTLHEVPIALGDRSYAILIGTGLLDAPDLGWPAASSRGADRHQRPRWRRCTCRAAQALAPHYRTVHEVVLPDGEAHKDWPTLNRSSTRLLAMAATARRCCSRWAAAWSAT